MNKQLILFLSSLFIVGLLIISTSCSTKVCEKVKEPYVEKTPYKHTFKYGRVSDSTTGTFISLLNYGTKQITKIKNFDEKGGEFKVEHYYRTLKKEGRLYNSTYINAGETKELTTVFDTAVGEDVEVKTEIIAPTETRYKEEIKYKEVEKCYRE